MKRLLVVSAGWLLFAVACGSATAEPYATAFLATTMQALQVVEDDAPTTGTGLLPNKFRKEIQNLNEKFARIREKRGFTKELNGILVKHTKAIKGAIDERQKNPTHEQDRKITAAIAAALEELAGELAKIGIHKVEFQAIFGDIERSLRSSIAYLSAHLDGLEKLVPLKAHELKDLEIRAIALAKDYVNTGKKDRKIRRDLRSLWNEQFKVKVKLSTARMEERQFSKAEGHLVKFADYSERLEDDVEWACDRMQAYGVAYGEVARSLAIVTDVKDTVHAFVGENGLIAVAEDLAKAETSMADMMTLLDKGVSIITDFTAYDEDVEKQDAKLEDTLKKNHGSFEDWIDDLAAQDTSE